MNIVMLRSKVDTVKLPQAMYGVDFVDTVKLISGYHVPPSTMYYEYEHAHEHEHEH